MYLGGSYCVSPELFAIHSEDWRDAAEALVTVNRGVVPMLVESRSGGSPTMPRRGPNKRRCGRVSMKTNTFTRPGHMINPFELPRLAEPNGTYRKGQR